MLAALLVAGLVAAGLSTVVLLASLPAGRLRSAGAWPWSRRLFLALVGTVVVDLAAAGVLWALGSTRFNIKVAVVALTVASLVWLPVTRRWNARGHLCWVVDRLPVRRLPGLHARLDAWPGMPRRPRARSAACCCGSSRCSPRCCACAYLWELCDALGTEHWRRRIRARGHRPAPAPSDLPFVSLHVPAHNEPPDMVIETLRALLRLDYPSYQVVVIDDNTDDEALWRPVEQWCAEHGVTFAHLEDWPGYKSGALNYALRELTDPRAELIGVVDSDYQLEPGLPAPLRAAVRRPLGRLHPGAAGLPGLVARAATTGGSTTPTSTSSRCRSPPGTSATVPSSPARWA